jgi:transposase
MSSADPISNQNQNWLILKKCLVLNVHLIFPEYNQVFSSVFTKTLIAILKETPSPLDELEMGEERLFELMKITSRNYYSPDKTKELLSKEKDSISSEFMREPYCSNWNPCLS